MYFQKQLVLIAIVALLLATGLIVLGFQFMGGGPRPQGELVEIPNLPKEDWLRVIRVTDDDQQNTKVATNAYDGYRITVPKEWSIPESISRSSGLKIFFNPYGNTLVSGEYTSGLLLGVTLLQNSENLSVTNWLSSSLEAENYLGQTDITLWETVMVNRYAGYKHSTRVSALDENSNIILLENSAATLYALQGERGIYILSCSALGQNFMELVTLCEKNLDSFELL